MNEKLLRLLGELLSGIAVPGSMGMLGAGQSAWRDVLKEIASFGYLEPSEMTELLRKALSHVSERT